MNKIIPFSLNEIKKIKHDTPFYIYDEKGIISSLNELKNSFNWCKFKEFFAVKATPTPYILNLLKKNECGMDCSSLTELLLAQCIDSKDIMFTSNNTPMKEYQKAKELNAIINFDDIDHIDKFNKKFGMPKIASIRYTPNNIYGNKIIGFSENSKFGMPLEKLLIGYQKLKNLNVKIFGLHGMLVSNSLNEIEIIKNIELLFKTAKKIKDELNINLKFIDIGGGFGIPYNPKEEPLNLSLISKELKKLYKEILEKNNIFPEIYSENGRYVTGPHGYLITKVLHIKKSYKTYIGVDANMANLMRPGMYGAYHHITVLNNSKKLKKYDVVGSLCENNDKFAIDRELPEINEGDYLVIHDVGAHGHSMGFNYNGKLRSAEFIYSNNEFKLIRRAQTIEEYFSTIKGDDIYV
ncbi:diaminopimelate decarboxylase [Tepiditoga spiralis]|uniref:Diaminopimelate decarboxylase n=1 Tax=Tepiditoga spiralis TaxID=2108365 RepID=A0A7G1G3C2_9BACT|nr:diaminopimelate decarboxylase [Tepiditoga spiralis]BBE30861.1 diaminopimelate decarboxylase [Tepiditoga spiralis]